MFKYLGVLLSHDLSWGEHVQSVCSKARKILGLLYRRFYNNAPSNSLVLLYLSFVRPHLNSASAIWSPHVKKDKIALENVQKFACHMATRSCDSSYQDLTSPVTRSSRCPSSCTNRMVFTTKTPEVSMATGVKACAELRCEYLASFLSSA